MEYIQFETYKLCEVLVTQRAVKRPVRRSGIDIVMHLMAKTASTPGSSHLQSTLMK
jgi:hypothetical protein